MIFQGNVLQVYLQVYHCKMTSADTEKTQLHEYQISELDDLCLLKEKQFNLINLVELGHILQPQL